MRRRGFTVIELVVVMGIVMILAKVADAPVFAADGSIHQLSFSDLLRPSPASMPGWGIPIQTLWHGVTGRDW